MLEISVVPVGTPGPSVSEFVAGALRILEGEEGIEYRLTPMGTVLEGDLDRLLVLAGRMHRSAFGPRVGRVVTTIKIDERTDGFLMMVGKLASVSEKLSGIEGRFARRPSCSN